MSTPNDSTKSPITPAEASNLAWLECAVVGAETAVLLAARMGHEDLVKAINTLTQTAKAFGFAIAKAEGR
jgi:hypothetical protein